MICLIQRVSHAKVEVNQQIIGEIQHGILALVGFEPNDTFANLEKMLHKLLHYRVFSDKQDKMNLNLQQVNGGLLLVPQFTLSADTQSGLRPSFSTCAPPKEAAALFEQLIHLAQQHYSNIETGEFGADMQVSLTNNGPVTFSLKT